MKWWPHLDMKKDKAFAEDYKNQLSIKTPTIEQKVSNLSGGNQQKVVLAKWLLTNSKIIIFDEPTRGIDVGVKFEIYQIMKNLTKQGISIIMVSSELPEIIGISDRILVMKNGRISGELLKEEATQEKILNYAFN
jgi:ABC-type sugar transport system ATPase subunit